MDDAHLQQPGLNDWQGKEGYRPTKCTIAPKASELTAKLSSGKEIDQSENGCNAEWDTQICGCALKRPDPEDEETLGLCSWVKTQGRLPRRAQEECSYKAHHVWRGEIKGWTPPTYDADFYKSDDMWTTGPGLGDETMGKWPGACVSYVKTNGQTCTEWCEQEGGMKCVGGSDDAHHQRGRLNEWQAEQGYQPTSCTLFTQAREGVSLENNGCEQRWTTQVCACKGAL